MYTSLISNFKIYIKKWSMRKVKAQTLGTRLELGSHMTER